MTSARFSMACAVALMLLASAAAAHAQTSRDTAAVERFTFLAGGGDEFDAAAEGRFELRIDRWSTDDEHRALGAALADGKIITNVLRSAPPIGRLRWPGRLDYTVRYARRTARPDGGADIVLATDHPVWAWWQASGEENYEVNRFPIVQLRVDKTGHGEGKLAQVDALAGDRETTLMIARYEAAPTDLRELRREPSRQ